MLLMVEKGIRGGIRHDIHLHVVAYKKCIKDYHNNKESSDVNNWDV